MATMNETLVELLQQGAKEYDLSLNELQISQFFLYKNILGEWNEKMNLTAIEEDRDVILKHFIDSFSILPLFVGRTGSVIDVGTGAGFPGIPFKIMREDLQITLLDSLQKRVGFLQEVIDRLGLRSITAIHGRAEDKGVDKTLREGFDFAVARAVASLPVLLEYCLPFVKVDGLFIAMKGSNVEEVEASKKALQVLGGTIEQVQEITLPFTDMKRNIIIVRKFRHTPTNYPRKAGKPSKDPLM